MIKKLVLILLMISSSHAEKWENWAKNQQCQVTVVTPKNIKELRNIIKKAQREQKKVHAIGSGHSWSNIVCVDNGYLVNTNKLNKIVATDLKKMQVTVQAGIKLKDLNKHLAKLELCLPNQPAITEQSLAGVVSTATHGSGKTGTFASFITKVQLLTADGKLQNFSVTENADLFPATRTSFGSLGIMTELTIQCEPLFYVRSKIQRSTFDRILQEYKDLLKHNDFMQFYWNVGNDSVDIVIHNRIEATASIQDTSVGPSYQKLSGSVGNIYMEEEIAVPLIKYVDAFKAARELIKKEYQKNSMFSGILSRFVLAENQNLLSPAANRDVVFLSIITSSQTGYEKFYKKFYDLMLKYDGRPHWGKLNYLTKKEVQALYGNNFAQFVAIRKKLDPNNMFLNKFGKLIFD